MRTERYFMEPLEPRTLLAVVPLTPEFRVNDSTVGLQDYSSIAMDAHGNIVVIWHNSPGLYGRRFDSAGNPLSEEFLIAGSAAYSQLNPAIAMDADGDFVVTWQAAQKDTGYGIYARRYDAQATPMGPAIRVASRSINFSINAEGPTVAMDAYGDFVVAWTGTTQREYGAFTRMYGADGQPKGPETLVAREGFYPGVAMDAEGNSVVVWYRSVPNVGPHVFAQRLNPAGQPLGDIVQVSQQSRVETRNPTVDTDSAGNFVVTWSDRSGNFATVGAFARRFSADGTPLSDEFKANSTRQDTSLSSVTVNSMGEFVIAWNANGYGSGVNVYVQMYDSEGVSQGGEIRINHSILGHSYSPEVAMSDDGTFFVSWTQTVGNSTEIFARRFGLSESPGNILHAFGTDEVTLTASQNFSSISIADSAIVSLDIPSNGIAWTSLLSITGNGTLDLGNDALVVDSSLDLQPALLDSLGGLVAEARNGGAWNGIGGITSTNARNFPGHLTGLAIRPNQDANGNKLPGFEAYDLSDIIIMYTWNGDTNLDRRINIDDYNTIDTSFLVQTPGQQIPYHKGDFNFDRVINIDDYNLIDAAFLGQSVL
jgi:uncharacterized protein (UPF0248 family)